jgi:hypothetical protein
LASIQYGKGLLGWPGKLSKGLHVQHHSTACLLQLLLLLLLLP